jgi:hypothetical protein
MKNFIFVILFSIFLFGCATTNSVESKPRIKSDNLRLEAAMKNYAGYDELVKRGFDIHSLDYIENQGDFYNALAPYFYGEDGTTLDNHFGEGMFQKYNYIYFKNKFGTKEELLNEGYVENETMFYYPSNGEKDWRVGYFDAKNIYSSGLEIKHKGNLSHSTYGFSEDKDYIFIKIFEHPDNVNTYSDFFSKAKKKNVIIIDLSENCGGSIKDGENFINGFSSLKDKKIYCLIGRTSSCGERVVSKLLEKCPDIKLIGTNTRGIDRYGINFSTDIYNFKKLGILNLVIPSMSDSNFSYDREGIGIFPDYWANTLEDIEKTINFDLKYNFFGHAMGQKQLSTMIDGCYN